MEIVTYVLSGELAHRDSMGNHGVVGPGGIQFMSAGTGVSHSEFNNSADEPLHLVQMWVLPGRLGTPPSYGQMAFTSDERCNRWLTIVSGRARVDAPIRITQRATLRVARVEGTTLVARVRAEALRFSLRRRRPASKPTASRLHAGDSVRLYDVARLRRQRQRRARALGPSGGHAMNGDFCEHIEEAPATLSRGRRRDAKSA